MKQGLSCCAAILLLSMSLNLEAEDNPIDLNTSGEIKLTPSVSSSPEEQKVSLSLRNIEIIEALKFFSLKTGLSVIPTQKVAGRVTLTVENAPFKDVLDIMLRSNNLAYDRRGNIYNVMTEEEYKTLYGKKFSDMRKVEIFRLKYASPEQAFSLLEALKSEIGRLLVESESGTVLMMDTPERIIEGRNALQALEQKGSIKVFSLKYAKAKDIEEQLKNQLDLKKVGTIKADERTNQVIVQALPERMKTIEKLIPSLDKKTQAVLIETKIIKIRLSDQLDTGIEWEGLFKIAAKYGANYLGSYPFSLVQSATAAATATGWQSRKKFLTDPSLAGGIGGYPSSGTTTDFSAGTTVKPGEKMHVGIIGEKRDFDVMIKYLQTLGKTKILSNPTLTVINNQEAKIHVGERRAYVTTTVTAGASTTTTAESVTFVDVGIQLSVTPLINEDGYVTMKVKPEISSVVGSITTSSNNLIPIIDTSMAETTVIAKDGATIIIGGLSREEKVESSEQVPFVGKIPVLGFFFRTRTKSVERTELLIMLTPIICEGDKLVTPKDKENEQFGIKPTKKFDVFRQQIPPEYVPFVSSLIKGDFIPKGFKPYSGDFKEEISPGPMFKSPVSVNEKEELFIPKGCRTYK